MILLILFIIITPVVLYNIYGLWEKLQESKNRKHYSKKAEEKNFQVIIAGAGFSGLGMGIHLKKLGIPFKILEKSTELGGTWWFNTYPGCACDIPSFLYSYSFEQNLNWSDSYPNQPEILEYLKYCAKKYNIYENIEFDCEVTHNSWKEEKGLWVVECKNGRKFTGNVLISGFGALHVLNTPNYPGSSEFQGKTFHTGAWDHSVDLKNKKIAIIGNAASAIQAIPEIAKVAEKLYILQRTPNWISYRTDGPYSNWVKNFFLRWHICGKVLRFLYYLRQEFTYFAIFRPNSFIAKFVASGLKQYIRKSVKNDAKLVKALTPDYKLGCKRILISNEYYPTLLRDNVELISKPWAIKSLQKDGLNIINLEDQNERSIDADVIIYATGFQLFVGIPETFGRNNKEVVSMWGVNPQAYKGITTPDFPNFFMLLGPNTGLGHNSVVWMIECQIAYTITCIKKMLDDNIKVIDTKQKPFQEFQSSLDKLFNSDLVWSRNNCVSWYQNEDGKLPTLWPGYTFSYWWLTRKVNWEDHILSK